MSPIASHEQPTLATHGARQVYELWREVDGTYSFRPREAEGARGQAELVWSVEAESWEEAVAAQRRYLGWGG